MIPVKITGQLRKGEKTMGTPVYCSKCGAMVKIARGSAGNVLSVCGKCRGR